jgi:ribosomal protein S18 acetylase RimI-like enzyme
MGCDHGAAEHHGVPYVWFTDILLGKTPALHTPADGVQYLDFELLAGYLDEIQACIEGLARRGPAFPVIDERGIRVRQARSTDVPAILDITALAYVEVSFDRIRQEYFGAALGGREWQENKRASIAEFCASHLLQTIVAEREGRVVGFATYVLDRGRGIASIGDNAVHPASQGRGIGSMLQREVDRRMRAEGFTRFEVSTFSHDLPARRVYEKLGYDKRAETVHYLRKTDSGSP